MISNQVLQNTLEGLKEISRTEFCIIDTEGKLLATTFPDFEVQVTDIQAFVGSQADSQLVKGYQYFKVCDDYRLEYILVAHGDDEDTYMVGKLAAFQIQNLIVAYKERFDKDSFIKNLLLDNLLLVDIYNRAKKLHIDADVRRVVMMLEMEQEKEHSSIEIVKSAFGSKSQDFITAVDERSVIIVKELEDGEGYEAVSYTHLAHQKGGGLPGDVSGGRRGKAQSILTVHAFLRKRNSGNGDCGDLKRGKSPSCRTEGNREKRPCRKSCLYFRKTGL